MPEYGNKRPKKLPKILRTALTEHDLEKRILRKIYLGHDREFMNSVFERDRDGLYQLRQDLEKKELSRVVSLIRMIRKNRGSLQLIRLSVLGVLVLGIVVFSLLFKNTLLTRFAERGLETAFQARSEVKGLNLRLLSGHLSIEGVTVANRDRPMRNLFELGRTEFEMRVPELLKGNFVARRIRFENIRWNTERSISGALPGIENRRETPGFTGQEDTAGLQLPSLRPEDAEAFLRSHLESLSLPGDLERLETELEQALERWPREIEAASEELAEAGRLIQDLGTIRFQEISSIEEAVEISGRIDSTRSQIRSITDRPERLLAAASADLGRLESGMTEFSVGLSEDLEYLSNQLGELTEGILENPGEFILGLAYRYLGESFVALYDGVERAIEISERFRDREPREPAVPFRPGGVDVVFPSVRYPRFYLQAGVISFGSDGTEPYQDGRINDLSTAPAVIGLPTTFSLLSRTGGTDLSLDGTLSLHDSERDPAELSMQYRGFAVRLDGANQPAGLPGLAGEGELRATGTVRSDRELRTHSVISVLSPELDLPERPDALTELIAGAIRTAGRIDLEIDLTMRNGAVTRLSGRTNLDRFIRDGVLEALESQREIFLSRLEAELNDLRTEGVAELQELWSDVEALEGRVQSEIARLDDYREEVGLYQRSIENRIEELRREQERRLQEEVERRIQEILPDSPGLPEVPTIPSLPRAPSTDRLPRFGS